MKKFGRICVVISALILLTTFLQVWVAFANYDDLKYDIDYLLKWTASALGISVDSQKPLPLVAFANRDYFHILYKERTGRGSNYKVSEFYWPPERTIYLRNDLRNDPMMSTESLEGLLVHGLVHYFQHIYRGHVRNSRELEDEAVMIEQKFLKAH